MIHFHARIALRAFIGIFALIGVCQVALSTELVDSLEGQFKREGANRVNARLFEKWDEEMVPVLKKASTCHPRYLNLIIKLKSTANTSTLQAYTNTFQSAMQFCPASVLRALQGKEVALVCSSADAADTFPTTPADVILKQRIQKVRALKEINLKSKVRDCIAAYEEELNAVE